MITKLSHITNKSFQLLDPKMDISDILAYWFDEENEQKHFHATEDDDREIKEKFEPYLSLEYDVDMDQYDKFAFLILYDQLVRHFDRSDTDRIQFYHQLALNIAMNLLNDGFDLVLKPLERCFLLLPLRHTFQLEYLEIVLEKIKSYREEQSLSVYDRFFKATVLSYSQLLTDQLDVEPIDETITNDQIFDVLDDEEVTRAIPNLEEICHLRRKNPFYRAIANTLNQLESYDGITISLSGGVDSMVCCFVLHHYLKNQNKDLVAVMIDYGNRDSCPLEVEMVKRWAALLGIRLYVRHIHNLKRNRKDCRNMYEQITREIRFQMYKKFGYPVILGHNYSDCEENILTNILKKKHYENLKGMNYVGTEKGVTILRPLLDIPKPYIYEFANEHKIPHLYDSTPDWSMRGQMRNTVIPALTGLDEGFMNSLTHLSNTLTEMYQDTMSDVELFFDYCLADKENVSFQIDRPSWYKRSFSFWQKVILDLCMTFDYLVPSSKAIKEFCTRVKGNRYGKIQMNSSLTFEFRENCLSIQ